MCDPARDMNPAMRVVEINAHRFTDAASMRRHWKSHGSKTMTRDEHEDTKAFAVAAMIGLLKK